MAEVDPTMGDKEEGKSRLDDIKYYTSLFLGALAINCVFGFLFLVPFVLDPAISTLMHDFIEDPVHCRVSTYELRYGKTNCSWASCREGCTAEIFKCHQVRVTYTPKRMYENNTLVDEIEENEWAYLTRTEKKTDPDTGEALADNIVEDTPLLINIKGCGYPPEVNCDAYAEKYHNHSLAEQTFPCHYSRMNPWVVLSFYSKEGNVSSVLCSILIPNGLFVLSVIVLVYWYCPYCQTRCRKYEHQQDEKDITQEDSDEEDFTLHDK